MVALGTHFMNGNHYYNLVILPPYTTTASVTLTMWIQSEESSMSYHMYKIIPVNYATQH